MSFATVRKALPSSFISLSNAFLFGDSDMAFRLVWEVWWRVNAAVSWSSPRPAKHRRSSEYCFSTTLIRTTTSVTASVLAPWHQHQLLAAFTPSRHKLDRPSCHCMNDQRSVSSYCKYDAIHSLKKCVLDSHPSHRDHPKQYGGI